MNTYGTYLMKGTTAGEVVTYAKLVDIVDFPDLEDEKSSLENTTLSNLQKTFDEGIAGNSVKKFKINYDKTIYTTLKALENAVNLFAVWIGETSVGVPDGSDGKWKFPGKLSVRKLGGKVDEVQFAEVSITPTGEIVFE